MEWLPGRSALDRDTYAHHPLKPTTSTGSTQVSQVSQASQPQQERNRSPNPAASTHAHGRSTTAQPPSWDSFSSSLPVRPAVATASSTQNPSSSISGNVTARPQHGNAEQVGNILPRYMRRGSLPSERYLFSSGTSPARATRPLDTNPDPSTAASGDVAVCSSEAVGSQSHDAADERGGDGETTGDMGGKETDNQDGTDTNANFP